MPLGKAWLVAMVVVSMCLIWAATTLAEGLFEGEVAAAAALRSALPL